ncbi:hypothetical protein ACE193_06220 [Bernardetia sp. OM2101]|uniref:hypothetical protein n=1 Tax=Bernardetia sp. OM2101 TaxID=3344876 RepID=UPI0035CF313B
MNETKNTLKAILEAHEKQTKMPFKPNRAFFTHIGIGSRRFYQLIRNEKPMMFDEMQRLAKYFNVHIFELHECTLKYLSEDNPLSQKNKPDYKKLGLIKS